MVDNGMLAVAFEAGELVFGVLAERTCSGSVDQYRRLRELRGSLRGSDHEGVGPIGGVVHVEHVERRANHATGVVLVERQGPAHCRGVHWLQRCFAN